jgi:hypothetical protein
MEPASIAQEIESLPPEARKQVADFVAFLKARYPPTRPRRRSRRIRLVDEPFVGMWRDRDDMGDTAAGVKGPRWQEWRR